MLPSRRLRGAIVTATLVTVALVSNGHLGAASAAGVAADSSFTPVGMWRDEGTSGEEFMIVELYPYPGLALMGREGLQALGFYGADGFEGVVKRPGVRHLVPEPRGAVLRFRANGPDRLAVEFAAALGAASTWRGTFVRTRAQVPAFPRDLKPIPRANEAQDPGPGTAPDRMPAFGEYVYVEQLPTAIERMAASYPDSARAKGIQGTVIVQALVGRDGRVRDTRITASVPDLDEAAIAAVRQWRFEPARAKGEAVAVWVAVPVRFTLR